MPNWGKGREMRTFQAIAHDLAWTWYRMRRHVHNDKYEEALKSEVWASSLFMKPSGKTGNSKLRNAPKEPMRKPHYYFHFFRDVRPPFYVLGVKRIDDDNPEGDEFGELHEVTYECGLEHNVERGWGVKRDAWPLDNKTHGIAVVRIPDGYPRSGPLKFIDWGDPALRWTPDLDAKTWDEKKKKKLEVPIPSPHGFGDFLARELEERPSLPRFASIGIRPGVLQSQKEVKVLPMRAALLGPQKILPELAKLEEERCGARTDKTAEERQTRSSGRADGQKSRMRRTSIASQGKLANGTQRKRQLRVCTGAAGFVTYEG